MTKASTRDAFGEALLELARGGLDVVGLSADTSKSMGMVPLAKEFPDRWVDVGIAEQSMLLTAAGLATTGKTVFAASYSVFTSMRALEQLRTFIAYPSLNVKVVAGLGGFSAGIEGATHIAIEDLSIIRAIPNVALLVPADALATRLATFEAARWQGPVYIRIGRDPSPVLFDDNYHFTIGKANTLRQTGCDVAILATGLVLAEALRAADVLEGDGLRVSLLEVHTLKPLDEEAIVHAAYECGSVVTVEENSVIGGLGGAVAEVLARRQPTPMEMVAAPDRFSESDTPDDLKKAYGLTVEAVVEASRRAVRQKTGRTKLATTPVLAQDRNAQVRGR